MERTIEKIDRLLERIEQFERFQAGNPELDLDELEIEALDDEELAAALQVGQKLKYRMNHLDLEAWKRDLKSDRDQLYGLFMIARDVSVERDAKLARLKELIAEKAREPSTNRLGNPNRKALVFTAFADTALYLYDSLKEWARQELGIHIALVTGGAAENRTTFGRNDFNHILTNFAPLSKYRNRIASMAQDEEIDLLIATDCISEGQNLQDCDMVINYDIHWNPVRLIQRFGRIDRIGSINDTVRMVNFWPTPNLDGYIKLKSRVEARMALVDITATGEDNLLRREEAEALAEQELSYRDRQLLRLREEVLDLEDISDETVALNEFTLDDFRIELSKFIESNRKRLQDAPLGLYAVVPHDPAHPPIRPGVIFCLEQKGGGQVNEKVNPLQPYFLVYVRDDGEVRYGFAQPKQILDIYRHLCAGKSAPYKELCQLFDRETRHGEDMAKYNTLLKRALESITGTYQRRALGQLLGGRDGMLAPQSEQVGEGTEFELITWLLIR
jgi:SNF2 family DNA or RNA helicase